MEDEFLKSEYYWIRRPGPTGGIKGSEALTKKKVRTLEDLEEEAAQIGGDLLIQFIGPKGKIGRWFPLEVEELEPEPYLVPQTRAPQQNSGSFELFRMQMELDRLKEDKSRAVDTNWLQDVVRRQAEEITNMQRASLEREREAYQKGKQDAEEAPTGEGFNFKDIGPILETLKKQGGNPQTPPGQAPQQGTRAGEPTHEGPDASLRELMGLVLTGAITPQSAPEVIRSLFGKEALNKIIENRAEIFQEMAKDEGLTKLYNGNTSQIITLLNGALEHAKMV